MGHEPLIRTDKLDTPLLVRDLAAVIQLTRNRESAQTRLERLVGCEMATLLQEIEQLAEPIGRAA